MAIQFFNDVDVETRVIVGTNNTVGSSFDETNIIGGNNNTSDTGVTTNTSVILGDGNGGRYGNIVVSERTLKLGTDDNVGATSSNTTGGIELNSSWRANSYFANVGGFLGYFPPPTTSNEYLWFYGSDNNSLTTSSFSSGNAPEAAAIQMEFNPNFGTNSAGNPSNALLLSANGNNSSAGALYFTLSQNNTTSSRGIVTFDCRHRNNNYEPPDGMKMLEVTGGWSRTKFVVESGGQNNEASVGIEKDIFHLGDTDTHFGFVANDNWAVTTAGSERIRVTSGGSLGVGTNNPVNKLDVTGNIGIDEYIVHNGDTNTKFGFSSAGVVTFGADPANPTWYLDLVNKKAGFRTTTPGSAFDVNGTFRARNELNVGATSEQNFFVEGGSGPRYVKMGAYTPTNKDTWLTGATNANLVRGTAGFGTGGKVLMATYRYTTKIEAGGWPTSSGFSNGVNVTPTPLSTQHMIVKGIFVHRASGTIGSGWSTDSYPVIFTQKRNNGDYSLIGSVDRNTIINGNYAWFYNAFGYGTGGQNGQQGGAAAPVVLSLYAAPITNEPTWYITVEYSIIKLDVYRQNVDQTLT